MNRVLKFAFLLSCLIVVPLRLAHAEIHAWPFLELSSEETTVFYPFFSRDESLLMVFPLYYRIAERDEHHILWPFVKVQEGRLARVFPFWFSENRDSFTFFPLVFGDRDGTIVVVPPMKIAANGSLDAVYPFWARSVNPLKDGSETNTHILWPLYSRSEVRNSSGTLVSRNRRWIIFSDTISDDGAETLRILGIPISERFRARKS